VPPTSLPGIEAQQIVGVLTDTLDRSVWNGAQNLFDLYEYLYRELIDANLTKNAAKVAGCAEVVRRLAAAWHEAAGILASQVRVEQHSGVA
jgi:flagellar protein FliS